MLLDPERQRGGAHSGGSHRQYRLDFGGERLALLSIELQHVLIGAALPPHHKDPAILRYGGESLCAT